MTTINLSDLLARIGALKPLRFIEFIVAEKDKGRSIRLPENTGH
jgi:hypothetical protein